MDKIESKVRTCIATLNIIKHSFEKEATPRRSFRNIRSDLTLSIALIHKQLPQEPLKEEDSDGLIIKYYCPSCKRYLGQRGKHNVIIFHKENYCQREGCGQALKWKEESGV